MPEFVGFQTTMTFDASTYITLQYWNAKPKTKQCRILFSSFNKSPLKLMDLIILLETS